MFDSNTLDTNAGSPGWQLDATVKPKSQLIDEDSNQTWQDGRVPALSDVGGDAFSPTPRVPSALASPPSFDSGSNFHCDLQRVPDVPSETSELQSPRSSDSEDASFALRKSSRFCRPEKAPQRFSTGVSFVLSSECKGCFTAQNFAINSSQRRQKQNTIFVTQRPVVTETEAIADDSWAGKASNPAVRRKQKQCGCCGTTNTPLWRDLSPDLPLCNACGIRYKKYNKICPTCHYVPCKSERDRKICSRCGDKLPSAIKLKSGKK